ncbi:putative thiamine biosynthesis lipoprotein precursor [Actinacidiphila reveromycinica]|uniref:FAD:protein FMN transferase n=1 Tax=Actinacidiphila reveromycinica TaxID=659352 RepID=A0A7U3VLK9_9ACTN|nr:FAD:protein FMN transferase [Streptomyces sp. SN-593]BBA95660.1 putative thiamine biosynthesis lipoprotein precursor [Streptomyces sp. SN-593]
MGTVFSFDVRGGGPRPAAALEAAVAWLRHVDGTFSTYRPGSQISRLAAGTLALSACSPEVWEVMRLCEAAERRTGGWFSAGYRGGFDPTGLVKGWAVERVAAMLASAGAEAVCVNGGGDVQVHGGPWRIGVGDPLRPGRLATVVHADGELAVATSGPAERGCHIVDPHTGRPPADALASLTVVCRGLTEADICATAGYARGGSARDWLRSLPGTRSFAVTADGATWRTGGLGEEPPAVAGGHAAGRPHGDRSRPRPPAAHPGPGR